jgi:hypothetical protein
MNTAKMALLTEQNILLRHRVDTLEKTVLTLRREMNGAKNALGPWFRRSNEMVGSEADELGRYFPSSEEGPRKRNEGMYGRTEGIVAPLEVGTTLEGTLVGLRESVVGLAAGVDAAGRRGEIALTNETLRMSVRAQMHGLRMQVHGMMMTMDRNAAEGYRNYGLPGSITKL